MPGFLYVPLINKKGHETSHLLVATFMAFSLFRIENYRLNFVFKYI